MSMGIRLFKAKDLSDEAYLLEDRIHGDYVETESDEEADQKSGQPSVIDMLVEADSQTVDIPYRYSKIPLYLAITSGKTLRQGIKALLAAWPGALSRPDTETGLLPFL
jgi:hypothetical protein